jgi:hypothetical protein|tara:strand:+ start:193 stop:480 length:288 start_codon:yes stop_codon:yes gene_type:complete
MKITKNTIADNTDRMAFVRDAFDMLDSLNGSPNTIRMIRMMRQQGFDATLGEMREICEWLDAAWRVAGLENGGVRQSTEWANPLGNPEPLGDELT